MKSKLFMATVLMTVAVNSAQAASACVTLIRTPNDGIQPQVASDGQGVAHLVYYKGDPGGGDVFYVRQEPAQSTFSRPLRVNSRPGSAMAMGTIRGAQLAVGKNGRVHVIWDGMGNGAEKFSKDGKETAPLLYTRLNDQGISFEPERNLITYAVGLDGGSSIAADSKGYVYAVWHAAQPGKTDDEASRAVFVARSTDEGRTFQREEPALTQSTGACPCCSLRAFADRSGAVYILFRAAAEGVNRDELLLVSRRPGADFEIVNTHKWKARTCPMSSAALTEAKGGVLAAWETGNQVYYAFVNPKTVQVSTPTTPAGETARKHPVAVANDKGETLLVWTEGTAWAKGGKVAWQLFASDGRPTSDVRYAEGVPEWSLATAFVKPTGDFVIVY
jgi:hypothetical protein